jgi:hypothetical protein
VRRRPGRLPLRSCKLLIRLLYGLSEIFYIRPVEVKRF